MTADTAPNPVVAIFAPLGADAEAISGLVEGIGHEVTVCRDAEDFARVLDTHPLCAVLTEEALRFDIAGIIAQYVKGAPLWSSIPLILAVGDPDRPSRACRDVMNEASSATLVVLKRPLRPGTFLPVCRTQIELRERQFQAASLMERLAEAERYQKFLLHELQHRTRNLLGILQATVSLASPRGGEVESFRADLLARVQSIAKAHNRLTQEVGPEGQGSEGTGAEGGSEGDLRALISEHVAPFSFKESQLVMDGPSLTLGGRLAFDLSLILHELATNAAKYGALSTSKGSLAVTWEKRGNSFCIEWRERGGPPVATPTETSFGTNMIKGLAAQHGGKSELVFEEEGLKATIEMSR